MADKLWAVISYTFLWNSVSGRISFHGSYDCFAKVRVQSSHCSGPPEQGNCCHLVEIGLHSLLTEAGKVCRVTP